LDVTVGTRLRCAADHGHLTIVARPHARIHLHHYAKLTFQLFFEP